MVNACLRVRGMHPDQGALVGLSREGLWELLLFDQENMAVSKVKHGMGL